MIRVKNAIFSIESLGGKDPNIVLKRGTEALDKADIPYWLSAGTALALYRDKDFLPYDTDLDVGVFGDADPEAIIKALTQDAGFRLIRTMWNDSDTMQLAFTDPDQNIIFDIYFYYRKNNTLINYNEFGTFEKPLRLFEPLVTYTHAGTDYSVPNNLPEYLQIRYGDTWETPIEKTANWDKYAANLKR